MVLQELTNIYWKDPGKYTWDRILRVLDQVSMNIVLDDQEFTKLGAQKIIHKQAL